MKPKSNSSKKTRGNPFFVIGREAEADKMRSCLSARKNLLLEGPVGVGKTHLALAVTRELGLPVYRIDGDSRYTEQKMSGWFDPPMVIRKGFVKEAFIPGPLVEAMQRGGVLFINELNRLPEGVQNVLLPAIDERILSIPRLGTVRAAQNFLVIATQNPKEFVATSHLSEAILDRFELVKLDYQTEQEEFAIVSRLLGESGPAEGRQLALAAVRVTRITREHPRVRRGASIRAAISAAEITTAFLRRGTPFEEAFLTAVLMAFPTRIEIEREADSELPLDAEQEELLKDWVAAVLESLESEPDPNGLKKKR